MPALPTQLRNRLEAAVKQARRTAEAGAKVALERLTVGNAEPGSHLRPEERRLRNRLRAHGRQLGDQRDPKTGTQSINRLIHECAYEHWHRMLFARFLAENHLLMHPDGVAVSLAECDELAADEGAPDGWTLAARYAARMLPQIFRPDDPVLQVSFAPEHKRALEKLVTELPVEVFTAEDSLGWVYQFWQAERKDEVNKSGEKITGETLPAVTQLFTEHYMVLFLLHNTIGAWWAARLKAEGRVPKSEWDKCQTEDDCRKLVALPGYEFTYLRFIRKDTRNVSPSPSSEGGERRGEVGAGKSEIQNPTSEMEWVPAAGGFPGWPKSLKDFKLLDPCCGSGHFLVAAFDLLVRLRMVDEGLSAKDACDAVIRENIHGLEIDPRCTQIAAFALALTAWKFPNLPSPSGRGAGGEGNAEPLGFRVLPPLNIACSGLAPNARKEDWLALANGDTRLRSGLEQLYDLFQKAPELGSLINPRRPAHGDLVTASFAEIQPLLTKALHSEKAKRNDDLNEIGVAAQGMVKAAELLGDYFTLVVTNVPYLGIRKQCETLKDFATAYYSDAKEDIATVFCARISDWLNGTTMAVVTPQNWFYQYRYRNHRAHILANQSISLIARLGEGGFESPQAAGAFVSLSVITCCKPDDSITIRVIDASESRLPQEKAAWLETGGIRGIAQQSQLSNPDARLSLERPHNEHLLNEFVVTAQGIKTGDDPLWVRCFWELPSLGRHWRCYQTSPETTQPYAARSWIINWATEGEGMVRPRTDSPVVGKIGVVASAMRDISATIYSGDLHYSLATPLVPLNPDHLTAIWAFCSTPEYNKSVREIEQNIAVTTDTLAKVPFDLAHWQRVAAEKYPHGLPKPYTDDPTQWLFDGHPARNAEDFARLKDDPATRPLLLEPDGSLSSAPSARRAFALQVAVARLLGYHWPRQTGSSFPDCPALGPDGLEKFADEDGIVCIPSVRGETPAAERLRALLAAAYGKAWSPGKLDELLSAVDYAGSNLEDWLRNGFFEQHCKLFHHRPFIWQIWDGRKDGFSALVNYHKLDHKLLEKLTYTYLGDWIKKQQEAVANEESGADDRLLKAQQLQDKLKLILEGEAPYDIFVRWKPLEQQPIGWHPDLNDGVRLNIRPFVIADVLRKRPNIKWGKDRGKNPPGSPWGEVRDNDRHLTLAEKRAARGK